eukprot:COSAG04_NODE_8833_length_926_cov_1.308343_2_plen_147_part_01
MRGQALELHRLLHHRTVSHQGDGVAPPTRVAALAQVASMARGRVACGVADVLGIGQPQEVIEAVVRRQVPGGVPDVPLLAPRRFQQFQSLWFPEQPPRRPQLPAGWQQSYATHAGLSSFSPLSASLAPVAPGREGGGGGGHPPSRPS